MTYLQFHLVFILPPLLLLWAVQPRPMGGIGAREAWKWIGTVTGIAFLYTTPWDNYLVWRGVWGYGEGRVLGVIGYVPVEEYLFFLLQPVLTGLWYLWIRFKSPARSGPTPDRLRMWMVGFWLAVAGAGALCLTGTRTLYLGLILIWAAPVLAGMSWLGADTFWQHRRGWALGITVPTLYLWFADRTAIALGVWDISDRYSVGFDPLGLPIEEAVFFFVTNVLVVQGLLLFLPVPKSVFQ